LVAKGLLQNSVPAISFPPACLIVSKDKKIAHFNASPVLSALKLGMMPILYGDMVPDKSLGFSVCSGDQIARHLGKMASKIIFATDVDGVFAEGKLVQEINRENFPKLRQHIGKSRSPDVTGGMEGKIAQLKGIGKPAYIVNARKPNRILNLLLGRKAICTKITL
ncbi:MAG: hypothetical protein QW275_01940, partial [Candidatus Anstonellaceae archaeon]